MREADLLDVHAALTTVVPRLSALIRGIKDRDAPSVGRWTVAETAIHVGQAWDALPALAAGHRQSPLQDIWDLGPWTEAMVRGEAASDLGAVADRIDASADAFLAAVAGAHDGQTAPWIVDGISVPASRFACHLLNEALVHGDDIARSESRDWRIESDHAALSIMGFVVPTLAVLDSRAMVEQEEAAGLRACFDLRLRGGRGRCFLVVEDGELTIEEPSARQVDCHLACDPATLVLWGRRSQWPAILTGRLLAWGRRPWLGPRLRAIVRNP